jgi:AcrR family transcriptional regulator
MVGRKKTRLAGGTREIILRKARRLFAQQGFDAASMQDIAREVGIRKASLYAHFPGKEAIFREVFATVLTEYTRHLEGIGELGKRNGALRDRLTAVLLGYAGYFTNADAMSFWFRVFMTPPVFMKQEIARETMKVDMGFVRRLTRLFREGMSSGELKRQNAESVSTAFYQMLMGLGMTLAFYPGLNVRRLVKDCLTVFWNGIGPAGAGAD